MKNKLLILRVTFALFLLVTGGAFIAQSSSASASDCAAQRWSAFLNANSLYSRAFNQVHRNQQVSCDFPSYPHCNTVCSSNPASPECISCRNSCDVGTNDSIFGFAQGYLASVSSQFCTYEPDYCGNARAEHNICSAIHGGQLQNPVYDPEQKGQVLDDEWFSDVIEQYFMCREASGIDNCE